MLQKSEPIDLTELLNLRSSVLKISIFLIMFHRQPTCPSFCYGEVSLAHSSITYFKKNQKFVCTCTININLLS